MKHLAPATRAALGKLVRLLASNRDGEVVATARAIARTLKTAGADFHDFAAIVEAPPIAPNGGFPDQFDGDDDDWEAMVAACAAQPGLFSIKEQGFIETLQSWYGEPTQKQLDWLAALFARAQRAA